MWIFPDAEVFECNSRLYVSYYVKFGSDIEV